MPPVAPDPKPAAAALTTPPAEPLPPPRPSLDDLLLDAANLFKAGQFEAALKLAELVLKIEPCDGNTRNTRANALFKLGRNDEACRAAIAAIEASPGDLRFWLNKAVIDYDSEREGTIGR